MFIKTCLLIACATDIYAIIYFYMSCKCTRIPVSLISQSEALLSMPRGVDYEVIGFGMEVQPLFTYNEA